MPEVITDTSPIQYLYQINQLNLLPTLYGQVRMPQSVADKLTNCKTRASRFGSAITITPVLMRILDIINAVVTQPFHQWVRLYPLDGLHF